MLKIEIDDIPEPDLELKYYKINSKIIKYFTTLVRGSYEYRLYIDFLKNMLEINECTFFENYNMKNGLTIEIHHSPLTLYDICETVANKQFENNGGWVCSFDVCEEVTRLHFEFKVGLIPLNPTAHELAHAEKITIYPSMVFGDWNSIENEYSKWMSESVSMKLIDFRNLGDKVEKPEMFEKNPVMIESKAIKSIKDMNVEKLIISKKMKKLKDS